MRASFAVVLALVCGLGCGSKTPGNSDDGGGDTPPSGDFTIAVQPAGIVVPISGSSAATITVSRSGMVGDIALTARDLPTGVTATFMPDTLPEGTDTSTVTVTVGVGAAVGTSAITIAGTAGTLEHTATLSLTATTITVTGTVAGGVSGITVGLVGKTSILSGANGTFTFTDVTPPYALYSVSTAALNSVKTVYYYDGLTRPDPVVQIAGGLSTLLVASGTVSGTLSGGNGAVNVVIAWGDNSGAAFGLSVSSGYTLTASWPFANTKAGTLYALQWTTKSSGAPNTMVYGSTAATITRNVTNTVNIAATAPATADLTGTIVSPAGYPDPQVQIQQQLGNNSNLMYQGFIGQIDATIPVIAAGTSTVFATTSMGGATSSFAHPELAATTDVSFNLPAPSVLTAPAAAATGVNLTTDFTFSAPPMTVNGATISTNGATKVAYNVYTTATTIRIPNVPEAPLPAGQAFSWVVNGYGPHASVDEVATPIGAESVFATDFSGPVHSQTTSPTRTFTSQ